MEFPGDDKPIVLVDDPLDADGFQAAPIGGVNLLGLFEVGIDLVVPLQPAVAMVSLGNVVRQQRPGVPGIERQTPIDRQCLLEVALRE